MAWQTPKVDWSREDGVRDDDLNRMEGNIAHLKGITDMLDPNILTRDITIYVSPSGNDNTGTGATDAPYRTITKALAAAPKNLSGRSVTISIAQGSYSENVTIEGFDAPVNLTGSIGASITISGLRVSGCVCSVGSISLISTGSVFVTNGAKLIGDFDLTLRGYSLTVNYGGAVTMNNLVATNVTGYVIEANRGGTLFASSMSGSGNASGIRSQSGASVAYGTNYMTVSGTQFTTATGGRIYSGSQQSLGGL